MMQQMHWLSHSRLHTKNHADKSVNVGQEVLAMPQAIDSAAPMASWSLEELQAKVKVRAIIVVHLKVVRSHAH